MIGVESVQFWIFAKIYGVREGIVPPDPLFRSIMRAASIEAGKAVFAKYCRSCHGAEGKGDGAGAPKDVHPANLTDAKWEHGSTDGEIFTTIKTGVPPKFDMDSWDGRIKDPDIWNVVNYIRTLGPKGAAKPGTKK